MKEYDVIVVGAGSGGMVGALTLAKAGKKVLLLEKHNIPGGAGTTFVRGRFEFDVALHTLWGIGNDEEKGPVRRIFEELDVFDKIEFVEQEEIFALSVLGKLEVGFPYEKSAFLDKLCELSPEESESIRKYQALVDRMAEEFYSLYDELGRDITPEKFPLLFEMGSTPGKQVLYDYIKHPLVRAAYSVLDGYTGIHISKIPFLLLGFLYELRGGHHVKGGAQAISNALVEEFARCGGELIYHAEVSQITVEDKAVTGVELLDGRSFRAGRVLVNANRIRTYTDFIDPRWVPEETFRDLKVSRPGESIFALYLGLSCPPEDVGMRHGINYLTDPVNKGTTQEARGYNIHEANAAYVSCYNLDDADYSEPGTSAITVLVGSALEPWLNLGQEQYHQQKFTFADNVLQLMERFYPGIRDHIEELEISTPLTHMRYLGSPGGAIYANSAHFTDLLCNKLDPRSPVDGLYFCGASLVVGGFNTTYMSGYSSASLMLSEMDGRAAA